MCMLDNYLGLESIAYVHNTGYLSYNLFIFTEMASKEQRIKDALSAIRNGTKVRRAGRLYGIPESSLRRRMRPNSGKRKGHPTLFNEAEENLLANHCIKMANIGYGLAPWQVIFYIILLCLITI